MLANTLGLEEQSMPRPSLPAFFPPFRYALVEDGIFRGAYPTLRNYRFLDRLRLRTMISLLPGPPISDLEEYCAASGIELIHHEVAAYSETTPLTAEQAVPILKQLINPEMYPIYLHCTDGTYITGAVVMILRRLQNWALPSLKNEAVRFTSEETLDKPLVKFIDSFRAEISVDPEELPEWIAHRLFVDGQLLPSHPCFKLHSMGHPPIVSKGRQEDAKGGNGLGRVKEDKDWWNVGEPAAVGVKDVLERTMQVQEQQRSATKQQKDGELTDPLSAWMASVGVEARGANRDETHPSKFSLVAEGLMLEGLTMRGSQVEHEMARRSGRTWWGRAERHAPGPGVV